jgi:hypothetical protein
VKSSTFDRSIGNAVTSLAEEVVVATAAPLEFLLRVMVSKEAVVAGAMEAAANRSLCLRSFCCLFSR